MTKYKTMIVDYEGLQRCLDDHAGEGWRLVQVTPDTWRKVPGSEAQQEQLEVLGSTSAGLPAEEVTVSYYLLIMARDEDQRFDRGMATASEELPATEFKLPDFP